MCLVVLINVIPMPEIDNSGYPVLKIFLKVNYFA